MYDRCGWTDRFRRLTHLSTAVCSLGAVGVSDGAASGGGTARRVGGEAGGTGRAAAGARGAGIRVEGGARHGAAGALAHVALRRVGARRRVRARHAAGLGGRVRAHERGGRGAATDGRAVGLGHAVGQSPRLHAAGAIAGLVLTEGRAVDVAARGAAAAAAACSTAAARDGCARCKVRAEVGEELEQVVHVPVDRARSSVTSGRVPTTAGPTTAECR